MRSTAIRSSSGSVPPTSGRRFTGGFPVNGSQSRSFTAADVGAKSQAMNLGVLVLVILTLLFLTPLFAPLPKSALAGVIIVVAFGLLDPAAFRDLARRGSQRGPGSPWSPPPSSWPSG